MVEVRRSTTALANGAFEELRMSPSAQNNAASNLKVDLLGARGGFRSFPGYLDDQGDRGSTTGGAGRRRQQTRIWPSETRIAAVQKVTSKLDGSVAEAT